MIEDPTTSSSNESGDENMNENDHMNEEEEERPTINTTSETVTKLPDKPELVTRRSDMYERAKYIPLRLSHGERKKLHILEAALAVSTYTNFVDQESLSSNNSNQSLKTKFKGISALLSGLLVASNYTEGQSLIKDKDFQKNEHFFQDIFEVGRRHKIMNPEKMRSEYGKLIYLLQDAVSEQIRSHLDFNVKKGIKTVYGYLEKHNALDILKDGAILDATREILNVSGKPRNQIQKEIKQKEKTVKDLCRRYRHVLPEDDILKCIYSLTDNNSFLNSNAEPIYKMLSFLKEYFKPTEFEEGFDLSIKAGINGARLTHNHENQYNYVLQSLTLWAEIMDNMFMLWVFAEDDILNENEPYKLSDTGQGIHRVQNSPQVGRAMNAILSAVQKKVENWVGSSVIHLGDHNVPNALVFIDKYTQVPRILVPIVRLIESLDELVDNDSTRRYIDKAFGGKEKVKKLILTDFFRYGFDGSGADNFIDAGSCIDGRLTSAWHWCSLLEKKEFYPIFLLSGFTGFDGEFQR